MEIAEEYRGSVFWEDLFGRDFSNGSVWLVSVLGMSVCGLWVGAWWDDGEVFEVFWGVWFIAAERLRGEV